jgi:nucleotide-binding universal stress UspA family protein
MAAETILVAVGGENDTNTDDLVEAVRTLGTAETTAVLAHSFDEDTYQNARDELGGEHSEAGAGERDGATDGWVALSPNQWHDTVFGTPPTRTDEEERAPEHEVEDATAPGAAESMGPDDVAAQYEQIKAVSDGLQAAGMEYEIRGRVGDAAETVLAVADEVDADAIAVDRRDRGTVEQALFGSVSEEIIENADRPVVVV